MQYKGKSVVIITYYRSQNYGAFLQAFATQEFLRSNSIDAQILEYSDSCRTILLRKLYRVFKGRKKIPANIREYENCLADKVLQRQDILKKADGKRVYDLAILGSDEIWNVKNFSSSHDALMFSKFKNAKRTVSYAACSGNTQLKHLRLFPYSLKGIKSLDAVSVRDDATEKLVHSIGRKDAVRVLDPTFLIEFSSYLPEITMDKPYLFVYSYGLSQMQIEEIKQVARKRNLSIVATGSYCDWADYNPVPNPFEWVSYIRQAEAVVTSTFHGTVFAIQQNKNVAIYNSKSPKILSVLKELKLLDRRVTQWRDLDTLLNESIDYLKVNKIIEEKRNKSQKYLLKNVVGEIYLETTKSEGEVPDKICYAARHKDKDVRWNSRSGGAFTALSDVIIEQGGIVYGAGLDDKFEVVHGRAETKEQRDKMRGSKYVQSDMTKVLADVLSDLKQGRYVLFTGTSCQVDAVRKLAQSKNLEENLLTVDFVCHGVPSPKIWKEYIALYSNVTDVDFRNKKIFGWEDHQETITTNGKVIHTNIYTKLYHNDLINRPCCHECPYAQYERFSDVTIGDCWGHREAVPGFNSDDSGISMIVANTNKGQKLVEEAIKTLDAHKLKLTQMQQNVLKAEGMGACHPSEKRKQFWNDFEEKGIKYVCEHYSTDNFKASVKRKLRLPHKIRFGLKKMMRRV